MTEFENQTTDGARNPGTIRRGFATGAAIALLALGGASVALADGGVGTGGGGGGGDGSAGDDARSGDRYASEWDTFSKKDKRWAHKTSECESGGNPKIHSPGGEYHGAFQFSTPTWKSSPMSPGGKHADRFSWKVQAVVAVKLMKRDGKGHWPVCG